MNVARHTREARDELDHRVEEERSRRGTRVAQEWRERSFVRTGVRVRVRRARARARERERGTTIEVVVDEAPNCAHDAIMSAVGEGTGEGGDGEADDGKDVNGEAEGGGGLAEATN